jgi:hypothetical protein
MNEKTIKIGGIFTHQHIRDGEVIGEWEESANIVVDEGLNHILDVSLSVGTQTSAFYIGLFKNNYAPQASDVAATFSGVGVANEATTEYSELTRPQWVEVGPVAKVITNSASPAVFTFASPIDIYGALLATLPTKATVSGKLIAASKFTSVRSMLAADVLNVTYTLTISST